METFKVKSEAFLRLCDYLVRAEFSEASKPMNRNFGMVRGGIHGKV
jgi:hypothetical protein